MKLSQYQQNVYFIFATALAEDMKQGLNWYRVANLIAQEIATSFSVTVRQVCGVIAALSPGCAWHLNIKYTFKLVALFKSGIDVEDCPNVGTYGKPNMRKAMKILHGEEPLIVLGGLKVINFFSCLFDPNTKINVSVDRHACSIAVGKKMGEEYIKYTSKPDGYELIANAYRVISRLVDLLPNQVQAITWCAWRRKHNDKVDDFMND